MNNNIVNCRVIRYSFFAFFSIAIILTYVDSYQFTARAKTKQHSKLGYENNVSKGNAKRIAKKHIEEVICNYEKDCKKWNYKTKVGTVIPLYDADRELCAYVFELKQSQRDAGYIVVGCNDDYPPIIEYSMEGKFIDDSRSIKESEFLVYDGRFNYYKADEKSKLAIDIRTNEKENLRSLGKEGNNKYTEEWNMVEASLDTNSNNQISTLSSELPHTKTDEDFITKPSDYESGYISFFHSEVPCYAYVNYLTMYDLLGYEHYCVPVAMTNLLMYWHERKFYNLMYGTSWKDSFELLYKYTGYNATKDLSLAPRAFQKYLNLFNIQNANIRYYDTVDFVDPKTGEYDSEKAWELMKEEILGDAPFLLSVEDHFRYGNHAVLVLGYQEFKYSNVQFYTDCKYSRYLLIEDGWSNSPNRYIHSTVGWDYPKSIIVTLYFIGK